MFVQSILAAKGADVATIAPEATVRDAVALLNERKVGALVVSTDGRRIDGILSERDVVRGLGAHAAAALDLSVSDLMTRDVTTCAHKDTLEQLMWLMTDQRSATCRWPTRTACSPASCRSATSSSTVSASSRARTRPSTSTSPRAADGSPRTQRGGRVQRCFQRLW